MYTNNTMHSLVLVYTDSTSTARTNPVAANPPANLHPPSSSSSPFCSVRTRQLATTTITTAPDLITISPGQAARPGSKAKRTGSGFFSPLTSPAPATSPLPLSIYIYTSPLNTSRHSTQDLRKQANS